jgi:hypothetical protein
VYHDVRLPLTTPSRSQLRGGCTTTLGPPPTSTTPRARNRVGGVPRRSTATHHPLALAIAWGVYHDTRPLPTDAAPRARNRVGGVERRSVATHHPLAIAWGVYRGTRHLGHPSRSQSHGGCTTRLGPHPPPAPLALASAWGVYSPTLGPHPTPAPSCLQLHGGVYHNALLVHYLDICCSLVVFENIIYEP